MKDRNEPDRLDELITRAVDLGEVKFDQEAWLDRLASRESGQAKAEPHRKIWRTIMDSRFTKYSVAATILVAASVVLFDPLGLFGGRHGVVLAEVAKRVNEMGTSVSTCTRTVWEQGREEPCLRANATVYASPEHGYMEEQYDADGNLTHRAYILKESRRFILVIPAEKKYMEISMSEEIFDRITAVLTPGGLISRITAGPYTELGRKRLNGLEVEGFEIRDPELLAVPKPLGFILPVNGITARVWIDVESSLPVEIDIDFTTDRALVAGFKKLRAEFRTHDIEWTAETPEGIFDPNIPADYTPLNLESTIKDNAAWIGIGFLPVVGIIAYRRRRRATLRHHHVRVTG